jgi:hypothetical protein
MLVDKEYVTLAPGSLIGEGSSLLIIKLFIKLKYLNKVKLQKLASSISLQNSNRFILSTIVISKMTYCSLFVEVVVCLFIKFNVIII